MRARCVSTKKKSLQLMIMLVVFIVFLLLPIALGGGYGVDFLTLTFIWAIVATSLRLLMSLGLINLAHLAFVAIGAYASALFAMKLDLSFWVALPASAVFTGIAAFVLVYPLLKLKAAYFFLGTFALSQVIMLIIWTQFRDLMGGSMGIADIPRPGEAFVSPVPYYYLALGFMTLALAVTYRLDNSRIGIEWHAIRVGDDLAESLGVKTTKARMIALIISGVFAGIGGSLYAHYTRFISPDSFSFVTLVLVLTFVVVGGRYSTWGPALGCLVLRGITLSVGGLKEMELIIYSIILIVAITLLPGGLVDLPKRIKARGRAKEIELVEAAAASESKVTD